MYLTAPRIVNRNRGPGKIDEPLLAGPMLLPQHQVQLLQPAPIQIAESAVTIAFRVALARFLPDQLQRQVLVRLKFLVDLGPVRLRVFAPDGGSRTVGEQPPLNLLIAPLLRHRPLHPGRLRGRHVFMDGALGKRTTPGDLMLAQSEGLEPQNFFQLTHGQPFLWQLDSPLTSGAKSPRLPCAAVPIPCRSPFRTTTVK